MIEALSAELVTQLEHNSIIDPRSIPVRFSRLKQFSRSAQHYWHSVQSNYDETLSMRLGTAAHALLFEQPLVVWPGKTRSGKQWDAFADEHHGTPIVNQREHGEAAAMAKAVRSNPNAMMLLDGAIFEEPIDWSLNGRACRSTPDARRERLIVDLKTSKTSEPGQFVRSGLWMSYHAQLAFYMDAVAAAGLGTPEEAYIIAVESKAPHPVTVMRISDRAIEAGRKLCRMWFERLLVCEASNEWPGYAQSIVDFDVLDADEGPALIFGED
jgi:hypothetical protein